MNAANGRISVVGVMFDSLHCTLSRSDIVHPRSIVHPRTALRVRELGLRVISR